MKCKAALLVLLFLLCFGCLPSRAQHVAISNNVVFDAMGALSAGVEIPFAKRSSFEVYGSIRPWKRTETGVHKHWLVQTQYRFWPCQVMNGFFLGPYIHGGEFNIGNRGLIFGMLPELKPYRYEGWFLGAGFGIGYEFVLAKHWNLGLDAGVGYTYIDYKQFNCEVCGALKDHDVYHHWGLSKLGLSIIYVF